MFMSGIFCYVDMNNVNITVLEHETTGEKMSNMAFLNNN